MRRYRGSSTQQGYGVRWRRARLQYLKANPLCRMCERRGITKGAEVVDHITPHKRDWDLFWDTDNWQPLCLHCHNSYKQVIENGKGCDERGVPYQVDW